MVLDIIKRRLNAILHFKFSTKYNSKSNRSIYPLEAIRQTNELRHSHVDSYPWLSLLPDPACVVDTKGNILAANTLFVNTFIEVESISKIFNVESRIKLESFMEMSPGIHHAELFVPHCNKHFSWSFGIDDALRKEILMIARYAILTCYIHYNTSNIFTCTI
jgi:hypothetical protein